MVGHKTRALPRAVLSTLVGVLVAAMIGAPGEAQPGGGVPDPGTRPTPDGGQAPVPGGFPGGGFPGGGFPGSGPTMPPTTGPTTMGPLAPQIAAKQVEINTVTQQLQAIEPQLAPAGTAADLAEQELLAANEALAEAELALDELVGQSYRGAAALPPDLFIPELAGIHAHAPALPFDVPTGTEAAAVAYTKAREEAQAAQEQYDRATTDEQTLEEQAAALEDQLAGLEDELDELLDENLEQLVDQEREREQQQPNISPSQLLQPVNGFQAATKAIRAVNHALSQLGKPYVWGAEGPNAYDCSGLVLWSYTRRDVGASLPRVANDQYAATRNRLVAASAPQATQRGLLPGDLLFFGRGSWQNIHHVGIYVGNGRMVHAPNSRSVVKVSPIWWSDFFGATRVFPARPVEGGSTDPTTPPGGGTTRPPTTRPPTSGPPPTTDSPDPDPTTNPPPTTESPDEPTTEPPASTNPPQDTTPPEDTEEPQEPTEPPAGEPSETAASDTPASETPVADSTPNPGPS
jgi:peptidoglycan DL-endopeptidase CwlO